MLNVMVACWHVKGMAVLQRSLILVYDSNEALVKGTSIERMVKEGEANLNSIDEFLLFLELRAYYVIKIQQLVLPILFLPLMTYT